MKEGRDAATLLEFLDALSRECADGIEAVAIDMGLAYIAAVQKGLPSAAIVFDRFHVMQMFSKVIRDCRRAQFSSEETRRSDRSADHQGEPVAAALQSQHTQDSDQSRFDQLLAQNQPLATLYTLKEQLQRLWHQPTSSADMAARLDDWCGLATAARITGLAKFVKTLQSHRSGICAYADHQITTARLEAGNVHWPTAASGAGFRDTAYPSSRSTNSTPRIRHRSSMPMSRRLLQQPGCPPYENDEAIRHASFSQRSTCRWTG